MCGTRPPRSAAEYQDLFSRLHDQTFSGGDAGLSVALPDGRSVFLFGDSVQGGLDATGGLAPGWHMVHNSMVALDGACLRGVAAPTGEVIPNEGDTYFWPSAAIVDAGTLYVFAGQVRTTGSGLFGFAGVGSAMAAYSVSPGAPPTRTGATLHLGDATAPTWGAAVAADANFVYVYGARKEGGGESGASLYVARVPHGHLPDPASWAYWDGQTWQSSATMATPVMTGEALLSSSMSVDRLPDGTWRVVSKALELRPDVLAFTAPGPTGPFTRQTPALASLAPGEPNEILYFALTHSEASLASGNMLLTFSRNNHSFERLVRDANYGEIQFVEVPVRPAIPAPAFPDAVSVRAGDASAALTWAPPGAGSGVTAQQVVVEPGGAITPLPASARSATVTGLRNWQPYSLFIRAVTAKGAAVSPVVVATPSVLRAYADAHAQVMSLLGDRRSGEYPVAGGRAQEFTQGGLYWHPNEPVHEVHGANFSAYTTAGGPGGPLGWPIADQKGGVSAFQRGTIYWTASTGAHEVHGAIRNKWLQLGAEHSLLGYPTTDELPAPDKIGRFNHFQRGSIYWTPSTGAHETHGAIRNKWVQLGAEHGLLGYPTTDEYAIPGGRRSDFQHGAITWAAATGAVRVYYQ